MFISELLDTVSQTLDSLGIPYWIFWIKLTPPNRSKKWPERYKIHLTFRQMLTPFAMGRRHRFGASWPPDFKSGLSCFGA